MKKLIIAMLMFSLFSTSAYSGEKIVLATLEWEPYIGQSLKNNGYVAELVKEAFKRAGIDVELQFNQWTRTVGLSKAGKVDGYFPEYYNEEAKTHAVFSDPFQGGPIVFFKLKSRDLTFTKIEDLKGLKIGTVLGYTSTKEFDEATSFTKDPAKDELTNFKKLVAGKIDLVVADKFVGLDLIKNNIPDKVNDIEFMSNSLQDMDLYLCLSKKKEMSDKYIAIFNKHLNAMKEDGTLETILKSHGF
jgi:polar amino acid transport system substrate-binding protein